MYITGRGVFAKSSIFQGERFLRYNGNLLTNEPLGDDTYVFEFKYKSKKYWYMISFTFCVSCTIHLQMKFEKEYIRVSLIETRGVEILEISTCLQTSKFHKSSSVAHLSKTKRFYLKGTLKVTCLQHGDTQDKC